MSIQKWEKMELTKTRTAKQTYLFVLRSILTNTTNIKCYLMNECEFRLTFDGLCGMLSISQETNKAKRQKMFNIYKNGGE